MDVVIIGGGAAGMSLAITASRENPKAEIMILEKNGVLGKKIFATGNGRCNLSNKSADELEPVLTLFQSLGLMIREEDEGRLYPYSEQASSVVEAFEREIKRLGIQVQTNSEVEQIEKVANKFKITLKNGKVLFSNKVALTTGGKAAPQFGTTGDGFRFAKNFGHRIIRLAPTLMPVTCEGNLQEIKGVRAKGTATLYRKGEILAVEKGEIQFTEEGLSGICIFNLSRLIKIEDGVRLEDGFREYSIKLDLVPEVTKDELEAYLAGKQAVPEERASVLLHSIVNDKLAPFITEKALRGKDIRVSHLSEEDRKKLSSTVKNLVFQVTGGKGWKFAQCTSGGVALDEINRDTMESKLIKGLFFGGEIIDFDGPCGGYNLQNAWINGLKAGCSIVKES